MRTTRSLWVVAMIVGFLVGITSNLIGRNQGARQEHSRITNIVRDRAEVAVQGHGDAHEMLVSLYNKLEAERSGG